MKRKRAREIRLVLTSAVVLVSAGCDDSPRYVYANLQDCLSEWDFEDCDRQADGSYEAPDDWDRSYRKSYSGKSKAIKTVKRGGFGSLARSFGGSRS